MSIKESMSILWVFVFKIWGIDSKMTDETDQAATTCSTAARSSCRPRAEIRGLGGLFARVFARITRGTSAGSRQTKQYSRRVCLDERGSLLNSTWRTKVGLSPFDWWLEVDRFWGLPVVTSLRGIPRSHLATP